MDVSEYFTPKEKKITDSNRSRDRSDSDNNLNTAEGNAVKNKTPNNSKPWASGWCGSGYGQKNNWNRNDNYRNGRNDQTRRNNRNDNYRNGRNDQTRRNNRNNRDRNGRNKQNDNYRNDRNRRNNRNRGRNNRGYQKNRTENYQSKNSIKSRTEPKSGATSIDMTPLVRSKGGWKPTKIDTSTSEGKIQQNVKTGQGYLNKMTAVTFDTLSEKFVTISMEEETLPGLLKLLIDRIFEQALLQPTFCPMYSSLCEKIHHKIKKFRMVLLNKCQEEFERGSKEPSEELSEKEKDIFRFKAKKRMLGNIKFIGELFKSNILVEPVMYECFNQLIDNQTPENPDEEETEALCKLMLNIGKILDHEKATKRMNGYFDQMKEIREGGVISNRIKFLLQDVEELRQNKWIPLR